MKVSKQLPMQTEGCTYQYDTWINDSERSQTRQKSCTLSQSETRLGN